MPTPRSAGDSAARTSCPAHAALGHPTATRAVDWGGGTRRTLRGTSASPSLNFTSLRLFQQSATDRTEPEQTSIRMAHPLRPSGAQGCSHGWSGGRALTPDAKPVEGVKIRMPAPAGRRKFKGADAHRSRRRFRASWDVFPLTPGRAGRPLRHLSRQAEDRPSRWSCAPSALSGGAGGGSPGIADRDVTRRRRSVSRPGLGQRTKRLSLSS